MQLRDFKFWRQSQFADKSPDEEKSTEYQNGTENVIGINNGNPLNAPVGLANTVPLSDSNYLKIRRDAAEFGPMSCEDISQFFSKNFVNNGRYSGSTERTQESLELGLETIVAQFQNVLSVVIGRRNSMIHALRNIEAETEGVSSPRRNQLELRRDKLQKELSVLEEQLRLSEERKGWVLSALNEYRIGFHRGLGDYINAAMLGL